MTKTSCALINPSFHVGKIIYFLNNSNFLFRIKDAEGRLILALEVFIYPLESTTFVDETFWRYLPRTANIQPLKLRDTADLNHELPTGLGNRKRSIRFECVASLLC